MTEEEAILVSFTATQAKRAIVWATAVLGGAMTVTGGGGVLLWNNATEERFLRDSATQAHIYARQDSAFAAVDGVQVTVDSVLAILREGGSP